MANIKFSFLVIASIVSFNVFASIAPKSDVVESNPQMINLNMQFRSKHKTLKSDLSMPFYQTAELEKKIRQAKRSY
ncbi:MAG: hypothetical protein ACXVCE_15440 [Bacteriovorax sp.]